MYMCAPVPSTRVHVPVHVLVHVKVLQDMYSHVLVHNIQQVYAIL